jgi:hypothetical protein
MQQKTTADKLQIKAGYAVHLIGLSSAAQLLGPLPADSRLIGEPAGADAALIFVADAAELQQRLSESLPPLAGAKAVWICYPKGNKADINRDSIRERMDAEGWEVVSNVSIDPTWSALRAKQVPAT